MIIKKFRNNMPTIGWREWVSLPDLGVDRIKAKIDTGARTSAIHATDISINSGNSIKIVRFKVSPMQDTKTGQIYSEAPLEKFSVVKSSSGHKTNRPTIKTQALFGNELYTIRLTLIDRDVMGFRLLLGREAIRNRFLIHPGLSFMLQKKEGKFHEDSYSIKE